MFNKLPGFTLIELLIVIGIIAIITGSALPGFSAYIKMQGMRQAQELVKSDLKTALNRALTEANSKDFTIRYWGLKFSGNNASNYSFITTSGNSNSDCSNASGSETSTTLPNLTVIRASSGPFCVFYDLKNGDASFSGTFANCSGLSGATKCIAVGYKNGATCRLVGLNSAGLVKINMEDVSCL